MKQDDSIKDIDNEFPDDQEREVPQELLEKNLHEFESLRGNLMSREGIRSFGV